MRKLVSISAATLLMSSAALAQTDFIDDRSSPDAVIRSLYNAIEREEFARAYSYFANPPADSVEAYANGYADTDTSELLLGVPAEEGAAGSVYYRLPLVLRSVATDGTETIYAGCYTLQAPNPANFADGYTPMAIEDGDLRVTHSAFGPEALPRQCGDLELPETDAALLEAERVFATSFANRCGGGAMEGVAADERAPDSFEIGYRYMHETSDDALRTARLFRFFCKSGAYNISHVYLMTDGESPVEPVAFAVPELDIRYENDDLEGTVEEMTQLGMITRTELINSDYDPDTQAITSFEKWRGVGDASASGRWIFRYGTFSLVFYEVDATYDGEINPEQVIGYGEAP
ncbi:DUF1176 domain-containing protein [Aliihoeflea sp. 40Bstr573]|uniref:DUF1176 domain-containing protein n=1 Tax=Aliihoeflea sp. 40Bstr573 TaxID=2696467 RepID=UPI00209569AE|nr:DUF1176 domain-containing protein [Aliihoeflea sp. 40Bstr573]MCO6385468.1 DUF1176 domain-containing protein [Aliihoeflea sp. 40Bstr573]